MAARAFAVETREINSVATSDQNTRKILEAIGTVTVTVAGLRENVMNMDKRLDSVSVKLDSMERAKAERGELLASEIRIEKTMADLSSRIQIDLSRKIGKDELSSVDAFENVSMRLDQISAHVEKIPLLDQSINGKDGLRDELNEIKNTVGSIDRFRWKVVGMYMAVAGLAGLAGYIMHGGH